MVIRDKIRLTVRSEQKDPDFAIRQLAEAEHRGFFVHARMIGFYGMKRVLVAVLALLMILLLGGMWFWSLASVPTVPSEGVVLRVEQGPVEVMHVGGAWVPANDGDQLSGSDQVRTGAGGRATVRFYHGAESRLQENSTLVIDGVSIGDSGTLHVQMQLLSGRVWSRLLRLFDLDGAFAVKTNSVVATVRGTAFDLGVSTSGTTLWVTDAAVDLAPTEGSVPASVNREPLAVPEGLRVTLSQSGTWEQPQGLTDADLSSEWFLRNRSADGVFMSRMNADLSKRYDHAGASASNGSGSTLLKWSEQTHLAFASSQDAPRLRGVYVAWRLYAVKRLIEDGNTGLASQELTSIEQDLQNALKGSDGKAALPIYRQTINDLTALFHDIGPSSPLFRMKLWLEDIQTTLADGDAARLIFARLLSTDGRLDEAVMLMTSKNWLDATTSLDAADHGITNGTRDVAGVAATLSNSNADVLRAKLRALRARAEALRALLTQANAPAPVPEATSTSAIPTETPTSTAPTASTVPPAPITASVAPWDTVTLSVQPNPVAVGSSATLRVTGSRSDGSTGDLTSNATFKLVGALGSLNGSTYHATQAGSVTVEASVIDHGVTKTARASIQIRDVVKLTRVDIVPQGPTTVGPGSRVQLGATAVYSNGVTANVTSKIVWSVSDPNIGIMVGNVFVANSTMQGSAIVTGTYVEQGTTVDGFVTFMVSVNSTLS